MLGRISPRLYDSKYTKFMSFRRLVVEISHVEGWTRKRVLLSPPPKSSGLQWTPVQSLSPLESTYI